MVTLDFKAATATIPIVGVFANPIEAGIVPSLARQGVNITGVSVDTGMEQWGKRVELLHQVARQAARFGILESRAYRQQREVAEREIARTAGVALVGPPPDHPIDAAEYHRVFAAFAQEGAEGIVVTDLPENVTNLRLIVELAEKGRLPTIYPYREFVEAGGLMNYGIEIPALGRCAADMADQILKGAKASEIPIFRPTKFDMVINLGEGARPHRAA